MTKRGSTDSETIARLVFGYDSTVTSLLISYNLREDVFWVG